MPGSALGRFGLELAIWSIAPAVFLLVYVSYYASPVAAAWPHASALLLALAGLGLVRLALRRFVRHATFQRVIAAALTASLFAIMLLYYALVLIGLESWGRVISWDLIATYAMQAAPFAEALDLSVRAVLATVAIVYLFICAATWAFLSRLDWTEAVSIHLSPPAAAIVVLAGGAACATGWYNYVTLPPVAQAEPISLTFFSHHVAHDLQGHEIDPARAERLDRMEDTARAAYRPSEGARRRNVILIVVDALRPDHLGINGYSRPTTPHLERLSREGALRQVKEVRASCAASACGLFSIAASKYVHQFSRRPFTLSEALQRHGYRVHMVLGGDHLNFYGIRQIYGAVDSYFDASLVPGAYVNNDRVVVEHLSGFPAWDGTPVMMQFHLMSTHPTGTREGAFMRWTPSINYFGSRARRAENTQRAINHYDNGVLQADALIHEILQILKAKQYLGDTLVVITADHGESLGEDGVFAHANSVVEEQLRIPLIFMAFGYQPTSIVNLDAVAAQVDIAPTILAELGMPRPATWAGSALQDRAATPFAYFQERHAAGLIDRRERARVWKYWVDSRSGREHAFDLSVDPMGRHDVIARVPPNLRQEWRTEYSRMLPGGTGVMAPSGT